MYYLQTPLWCVARCLRLPFPWLPWTSNFLLTYRGRTGGWAGAAQNRLCQGFQDFECFGEELRQCARPARQRHTQAQRGKITALSFSLFICLFFVISIRCPSVKCSSFACSCNVFIFRCSRPVRRWSPCRSVWPSRRGPKAECRRTLPISR